MEKQEENRYSSWSCLLPRCPVYAPEKPHLYHGDYLEERDITCCPKDHHQVGPLMFRFLLIAGSETKPEPMYLGWQEAVSRTLSSSNTSSPSSWGGVAAREAGSEGTKALVSDKLGLESLLLPLLPVLEQVT